MSIRIEEGKVDTLVEEVAKAQMLEFINRKYDAIRALRAQVQFRAAGTTLDPEQVKALEERINTDLAGQDGRLHARLCVIEDWIVNYGHSRLGRLAGGQDSAKAVGGFWFWFNIDGQYYECVELDAGLARSYYDVMNTVAKRTFLERYAYRDRIGRQLHTGNLLAPADIARHIDSKMPIEFFTAFISDVGDEFKIEDLVVRRELKVGDEELFGSIR